MMTSEQRNWELIDQASRDLTGRGCTPFTRIQVYEEIWRKHPDRQRGSLDPTFQGMVANATGGPVSAGGTPLTRVDRGLYVRSGAHTTSPPTLSSTQTGPAAVVTSSETPRALAGGHRTVDWCNVWQQTVNYLTAHANAGRVRLLTEDTLRFTSALALEEEGIEPSSITFEWPEPVLGGGKIDMVVDLGEGERAVVEFKFPRDARGPISPDTMTLGELLRDFHRVSRVEAAERWVVQLLNARLLTYLRRVGDRHPIAWVSEVGQMFAIEGQAVIGLPQTARASLSSWTADHQVVSTCDFQADVIEGLHLLAYRVHAPGRPAGPPKSDECL